MKSIVIELEVAWGSKFQKEFGENTLKIMLDAWATNMSLSHRDNIIAINKAGDLWKTK